MTMIYFIIGAVIFLAYNWIKIPREYERLVVFVLGKVDPKPRGPGLTFVMWPIEQSVKVSLRLVTLDVPPQDIITKDQSVYRE